MKKSVQQLEIGDVIQRDKTLFYADSQFGNAVNIAQNFNTAGKPAEAKGRRGLAKHLPGSSRFVVTEVDSQPDFEKVLNVADRYERQEGPGGALDVIALASTGEMDRTFVTARQLNEDGSYNPNGQKIRIVADDADQHAVKEVRVVKKMNQTFVPAGKPQKTLQGRKQGLSS